MNILVVGRYPPWPGPGADDTVATVRSLLQQGHAVEVLSDRPSAAHHHAELRGVRGAVALARRARSFDRLVLHLEPEVFARPQVGRLRRALDRWVLAVALRRWRDSVVRVDLTRLRSGVGAWPSRQIWHAATWLSVATEAERSMLRRDGRVPEERIAVEDRAPGRRVTPADWLTAEPGREAVMAEVRARSEVARATAAAPSALPPHWPATPPPVRTGERGPSWRQRLAAYAGLARRGVRSRLLRR